MLTASDDQTRSRRRGACPPPAVGSEDRALAAQERPVHQSVTASAGPLRQHTDGLVGRLNTEWRGLATDPSTRWRVRSWALAVPALRGLHDLPGVLSAATQRADRDVLGGLLLLARGGDQLAARTALQVMLGSAVRLARRTRAHSGGDLEESLARAVAATWQVIREYPIERRACRPADGISLDVLAMLTSGGRPPRPELAAGLGADLADLPEEEESGEAGELREAFWSATSLGQARACADEQLIILLAWGVRRGIVSLADARLLLRLHSPDEPGTPITCRDVAADLGVGHAAVRQRASRATRRLAAAVQDLVASSEARRPVTRAAA